MRWSRTTVWLHSCSCMLLVFGCASATTLRVPEPTVKLCISTHTVPVHLMAVGGRRLGTVTQSGRCIDLPADVTREGVAVAMCVRTTASNCVMMPPVVFANAPIWSLTLGFFSDTWLWDVYSLAPMRAA